MHFLKMVLAGGAFFLGLQLGMDLATKVGTMTTSTPAA
jgi:hypothetical protein